MQMVKRDAAPTPDTHSMTVEQEKAGLTVLAGAETPGTPAEPIRFTVAYRLRDYLGVLQEHVALEVARRRKRAPPGSRIKQVGQPLAGLAIIAAGLYGFGLMQPAALAAFVAVMLVLMAAPFTLPAWVALVGTPMYFIKRYRMPVCDFAIDAQGVTRVSAAGTLVKPWGELVEAKMYTGSYLLVFTKGAIPLPHRCLGAGQAAQLRVLLAAVRADKRAVGEG